ncbi:lysoplasmalogenase [Planococcus sp. YIM B11945]|uniref:lysoplasmalogenase n=1 Tax=Planococcus sp. YIM B11945 TaxID=3435410 RepID=UPI003D7E90C7
MKPFFLPVLILGMSVLYIFVIPENPLAIKLFFKLIPMALIIFYAIKGMPKQKSILRWLVLTGLFFCAVGDATLHWFIIGLSAFLVGHLFYMAGFFTQWKFSKWRAAAIIPLALYGIVMGSRMIAALIDSGETRLVVPVLLYVLIISVMAWSAVMSGNKWAIAGSLLFVASDSVLAWNMFVSTVTYSHFWIMSTYYGVQFLIAHSLRSFSSRT